MSCVLWHLKQSAQCRTRAPLAFLATGVAAELRSRLPRDAAVAMGGSRIVAAHADAGGGRSDCAGGGGGGAAAVADGCTAASPVSGAAGGGDGAAASGCGSFVCGSAGDCGS
jgi:hypothetical protein